MIKLVASGENRYGKWKRFQNVTTNGDRIRAMTDEELAGWFSERPRNCPQPYARDGFFNGRCQMGCGNCWLDWLKQEEDT